MPIRAPEGYLDITNATLRASEIVTTSNVGIANANPTNTLSIGSNVFFEDTSSNTMTVRGNVVTEGIKLGFLQLLPSYDLELTANVGNSISNTVQFTNSTTGFITSSNVGIGTNAPDGLVDVGTVFKVKFGNLGATAADIIVGYNSVGITESSGTYTYTRDTAANYGNFLPSTASYSPITGRRYRIKLTARSDYTGSIRLENPANGTVIASYDLTTTFTPYEWEFTATATTMYFRATITTGTTLQFNAFSMEVLEATANTDVIMGGTRFIKAHDASKNFVAIGPSAGATAQGSAAVAVGYLAGSNNQGIYATAVGVNAGNTSQGANAVAVGNAAGQTSQNDAAVAVGNSAGRYNQGNSAVAVGYLAGQTSQGSNATAVGRAAGSNNQGVNATAVGNSAGNTSQGSNTVAVGYLAGSNNQGTSAVAVGNQAGRTSQGASAVAVGVLAGYTSQGNYATAVGVNAGCNNQRSYATAVGVNAGATSQGIYATAVGNQAGQYNQNDYAIAVGTAAGYTGQGINATAVGVNAGQTSQGASAVAVGYAAGSNNQGSSATAVGNSAGQTSQGTNATALGPYAGQTAQGIETVAVGYIAGQTSQGAFAVAVGRAAGYTAQDSYATAVGVNAGQVSQGLNATAVGNGAGSNNQGDYATAVGVAAGQTNQGTNTVAVGLNAGQTAQGAYSVAMGGEAAQFNQGTEAVAVGYLAGYSAQGTYCTALGSLAGRYNQRESATALGRNAGSQTQGSQAVAVGNSAGANNQGSYAIAVGYVAGQTNQHANSIVLNASGSALNTAQASSFYVKPVRGGNIAASALAYTSAGEVVEETNVHFDTNGRIGIGTASPDTPLHIYTGTTLGAVFATYETSGNGYGNIEFRGSRGPGTNGSTIGGIVAYWQDNFRSQLVFTDGGDIFLDPTGGVGVRVAEPLNDFQVRGGGLASSQTSYNNSVCYIESDGTSSSFYTFQVGTGNGRVFGISNTGVAYADGGHGGAQADYAEMFEWLDGNPDADDRTGLTVALSGEKIYVANEETPESDIIGIVSASPVVLGNNPMLNWHGRWLRDDLNRYQMEEYEAWTWSEEGNTREPRVVDVNDIDESEVPENAVKITAKRRMLNPQYDPTKENEYVARTERPEWSAIGLLGRLRLIKGQRTRSTWYKIRDISGDVEEWFVR